MNPLNQLHGRHHSTSSGNALHRFQRSGSSDVMLLNDRSSKGSTSDVRRRPGSESDVLDVKAAKVSLHHQDSLMLAYHQRPSVIAGHTTASAAANVPVRQVKPVHVWNQHEVCKWLKKHVPNSQASCAELFLHHDITGKTLLLLNDSKLLRMGIKEPAHRSAIMNEILKLRMKDYMQYFKGLSI